MKKILALALALLMVLSVAVCGLTEFGVALLRKCRELGILIDVSHLNKQGFWDVAQRVEGPFIASYSNVAAIVPTERNLDDDQIREIIRRGGFIGMNAMNFIISETDEGAHISSGTVLIDGKRIAAIGKEVEIPAGVEIIDAAGRLVLPGFIDAHSHIGMWEESIDFEGADGNELTDPITPNLRAIDGVYPMEPPFADACKGGVTSAATGPGSTNVIGGQFAAIKLAGHCIDDMIIKAPLAMKCAMGENPKKYYNAKNMAPITRMAT